MFDEVEQNTGINVNDFEWLGLYDVDSPVTDAAGTRVKSVFEKLFQGTDIKSDDFYFLCFRSNDPNAFFVDKENIGKTKKTGKKHIVAVSDALIKRLDCDEELAAVIAHEAGHYLWAKYVSGKNTIFQERWSDVNSVDLMINAGYNPLYILEMQKKVFRYIEYDSMELNVHGTGFARAEDVKAYLTKKAMEQGDFSAIDVARQDAGWKSFQANFAKVVDENPYLTYLDKVLQTNLGTNDLGKLKKIDVIEIFSELVSDNKLNSVYSVRSADMIKKLGQMDFTTKTPEETKVLQDLFVKMQPVFFQKELIQTLQYMKLDKFGPVLEQCENIKNFIASAENKEQAIFYAKKIKELDAKYEWVKNYSGYWADNADNPIPGFYRLGDEVVGKMLPYDKLLSYGDRDIYDACYSIKTFYGGKYGDKYYYRDENGIVLAYGDEAKSMYKEQSAQEDLEIDKKTIENFAGYVSHRTKKLNMAADFAMGKISFEEYVDWKIAGNHNIDCFADNFISLKTRDERFRSDLARIYKEAISGYGYDFFMRGETENPQDHPNIKISEDLDVDALVYYINRATNPVDRLYRVRCCDVMHKLVQESISSKEPFLLEGEVDYLLSELMKFPESAEDNVIPNWSKHYRMLAEKSLSETPMVFNYHTFPMTIVENFEHREESPCLRNILKQLGTDGKIKSAQELYSVLGKIENDQQKRSQKWAQMIKFYIWADFLRHGGKADLYQVVELIGSDPMQAAQYEISSHKKVLSNTFGEFITDADFEKQSLYNQMCLYEMFEKNEMFSEKHANQNRWIRRIVDNIVSMPGNSTAYKYAEKILSRNSVTPYGVDDRRSDIQFFNEREKLINFVVDYWATELGKDDNSDDYLKRIDDFVDYLQKPLNPNAQWFSVGIKKSIADRLSNKVVAQGRVAERLGKVAQRQVGQKTLEEYDVAVQTAEAAFGVLAYKTDAVVLMVDFLSKKLTDESVTATVSEISKILMTKSAKVEKHINKSTLTLIHENFWGADLPVRAYMMNRLLGAYSNKSEDKLNLVVGMYFDEKSKYYKDAKLILNTVYKNLASYEKDLILAALASAGQRTDSDEISGGQMVGRGLKMFLQNKGPAFIKFGQLLSYLPTLDSDIRQELATLRDQANIPQRDELFDMLKMALPAEELNKISHVGKILGAGSFYVTVQIKYNGQDCVIALMRPYAHDLTQSGVNMISKTVDDLARADKKYAALKNIVNQARESAESELNIEQDHQKYLTAKKAYEQIKIKTKTADYSPDVARWLVYGADENKANAYKIMEMAPGNTLASEKWTPEEKRDMAKAYVALELAMLLSGQKWDTDRHQGQQNFYNSSFKDFCIGIFDTGAQMNAAPNKKDKVMLGYLLYELAAGVQQGKDISGVLIDTVKKIDSTTEKINVDASYIDGVQRGLTALSDIIEYQKEQKDEDGNVIVESQSLTADDFQDIVVAIQQSGLVDKTVEKTVVAKAVLDKLMFWRTGVGNLGKQKQLNENGIVVEWTPQPAEVSHAQTITKKTEEVKQLIDEKNKKRQFGIGNLVAGEAKGGSVSFA